MSDDRLMGSQHTFKTRKGHWRTPQVKWEGSTPYGIVYPPGGSDKKKKKLQDRERKGLKYFYITWHLAAGATAATPSWVLSIRKGRVLRQERCGVRKKVWERPSFYRFLSQEARTLHISLHYIFILNLIPYTKGRKVKQGPRTRAKGMDTAS